MAKTSFSGVTGNAAGKMGGLVFVRLPSGTSSMRDRTFGANPRTPAQLAWRSAMAQATKLYSTLSDAEFAAWQEYVQREHRTRPGYSLLPTPRVNNVFVALTAKFIAVNPGAEPSRMPPAVVFTGDGVSVVAEGFAGVVRFTASGPNSADIVTELLLQPLASPGQRGAADKYRGQGYHAFEPGAMSVDVPCRKGVALAGARFVQRSTGQASALVPLGRVTVG
ncbi:MAG: hypothetical protein K1X67_10790 [Fimbriimonadaceae bacterium]|nr:hypothetical protein [Fimbriimonadaceae bacterium]